MTKQKTKIFTFGNIMLTLLCAGTFAVAGLMYLLYSQVIITPETTAANYQRTQTASAPELMLPNGQTATQTNIILANQKQPAPTTMPVEQAASEVEMLSTESIKPAATTRKASTRKTNTSTENQPIEAAQAIELKPTNTTPEPRLERTTPTTEAPAERPLKPVQPAVKRERPATTRENNDDINNLF